MMKYPIYRIEYENGVVQTKNLIPHITYESIIKPSLQAIDALEGVKQFAEADKIKAILIRDFGNYFTDASPLFDAIKTGYISLYPQQGGNHKCKIYQT